MKLSGSTSGVLVITRSNSTCNDNMMRKGLYKSLKAKKEANAHITAVWLGRGCVYERKQAFTSLLPRVRVYNMFRA